MPSGPIRPPRIALLPLSTSAGVSWVVNDMRLLEELGCRVTCHGWRGHLRGGPDQIRIARLVATHDLALCWFGYKQAYQAVRVARWLRKPVAAVLGGFDVAQSDVYPEWPRKWIRQRKWMLDNLDALLAASEFTATEARALTDNHVEIVYLGIDATRFCPGSHKSPVALTISAQINRLTLERKGVAAFLGAAAHLPEVEFRLIGKVAPDAQEVIRANAHSNVKLLGRVSDEELLAELQNAQVYVQASLHEGFGVAVAEAMLCECVPVVSRNAALPEVVGDTGLYVSGQDPEEVGQAVRQAMRAPEKGRAARQRVLDTFPLSRRRDGLARLLARLLPRLYPNAP